MALRRVGVLYGERRLKAEIRTKAGDCDKIPGNPSDRRCQEVTLRLGATCLLLMTGFLPAFLHSSQDEDGTATVPIQRFPQIVSVLPMGAEPGALADVEVRGEFLDG